MAWVAAAAGSTLAGAVSLLAAFLATRNDSGDRKPGLGMRLFLLPLAGVVVWLTWLSVLLA